MIKKGVNENRRSTILYASLLLNVGLPFWVFGNKGSDDGQPLDRKRTAKLEGVESYRAASRRQVGRRLHHSTGEHSAGKGIVFVPPRMAESLISWDEINGLSYSSGSFSPWLEAEFSRLSKELSDWETHFKSILEKNVEILTDEKGSYYNISAASEQDVEYLTSLLTNAIAETQIPGFYKSKILGDIDQSPAYRELLKGGDISFVYDSTKKEMLFTSPSISFIINEDQDAAAFYQRIRRRYGTLFTQFEFEQFLNQAFGGE